MLRKPQHAVHPHQVEEHAADPADDAEPLEEDGDGARQLARPVGEGEPEGGEREGEEEEARPSAISCQTMVVAAAGVTRQYEKQARSERDASNKEAEAIKMQARSK